DQSALRQQLSHNRARLRAKRRADGELLLPRSSAGKHEVRHVRASDEEHRTHGGEQHEDGTANVTEQCGSQRENRRGEPGVFFWVLLLELLGNARQLSSGVIDAKA